VLSLYVYEVKREEHNREAWSG